VTLSREPQVHIADWGLGRVVSENAVLEEKGADIWAAGVLLHWIVFRAPPDYFACLETGGEDCVDKYNVKAQLNKLQDMGLANDIRGMLKLLFEHRLKERVKNYRQAVIIAQELAHKLYGLALLPPDSHPQEDCENFVQGHREKDIVERIWKDIAGVQGCSNANLKEIKQDVWERLKVARKKVKSQAEKASAHPLDEFTQAKQDEMMQEAKQACLYPKQKKCGIYSGCRSGMSCDKDSGYCFYSEDECEKSKECAACKAQSEKQIRNYMLSSAS